MKDEASPDPYSVVLADLKAQRDKIDAAISAIESLRGVGPSVAPRRSDGLDATPPMGPGAYLGMTIPDAAKTLLASERRTMGNAEIWDKLKAGGLHLNSADPVNTIASVLSRRFEKVGDVVRVSRGTWGLAEWYPGRSFRKADAARPSEQEQKDISSSGDDRLIRELEDLLGDDLA